MITDKEIRSLTEDEKVAAIIQLLGTGMKTRALKAQQKQINEIVTYMEENSLVEKIGDKDDKSWDRLKSFVDSLDVLVEKYDSAQKKIINLDSSEEIRKKASNKSIINFLERE